MIDLTMHESIAEKNVKRCQEKNVILPTFEQMKDPSKIPEKIAKKLKETGLWDIDPVNLFRISWKNEPVKFGGTHSGVNYIELPSSLTGTKARVFALVGKWFPTGAHKVGATYGCLAPALVTGNFDSTAQKAVWPSTGNYCRGGAYNSQLLGCDSIAILPEEMSRERFEWLKQVAGEVIATPGCESNVKEIFDKCHELNRERGTDIVIFNQFDQFENYLWHYEVTGNAFEEIVSTEKLDPDDIKGFVSATGSGGTLAAGDYLKQLFPTLKIGAAEALQCPTLLRNGFGGHRIEGIGDKHVPWVHNVRNTDMILAVDDNDCMDILRLFNEESGKQLLMEKGVPVETIKQLELFGISGIGNVLGAIKMAKYYEFDENDVIFTVLTDSSEMYLSRIQEMHDSSGQFDQTDAAVVYAKSLKGQNINDAFELSYYDRLRVHNLKYYTWIEQQGKDVEDLNAQWYDKNYWTNIQALTPKIDALIEDFNKKTGLL
ncbi:MAG: pyridoxal-phosphate dependent enzyme [Bacteroidetes bacterium]|nr:pyridoxal-phosphate dependent enzyme [Bacteroidota bacterium]